MNKMKTKRVRKLKIQYIPEKHFDRDSNNIIGATSFKDPKDEDKFFMYKNVSFMLKEYKDDKRYLGYIPLEDSTYVAIEKRFIFILILIFIILTFLVTLLITKHTDVEDIVGSGFDLTEDDVLREGHVDTGKVVVTGYDYLYLTKGEYLPLQCSSKNVNCLKFSISDSNNNILFESGNVSPNKEDRWYITDELSEGENTIYVKTYEVLQDGSLGNSVTSEMIINWY